MNNILRFHLKTWQWVSVLVVMAVIVGGVFVVWNRERQIPPLLNTEPVPPLSIGQGSGMPEYKKEYRAEDYCEVDSECTVQHTEGTLCYSCGCPKPININNVKEVKCPNVLEPRTCNSFCPPFEAKCIKNQCTSVFLKDEQQPSSTEPCIFQNGSCCRGEICGRVDVKCKEGTDLKIKGCDENCKVIHECVPLNENQTSNKTTKIINFTSPAHITHLDIYGDTIVWSDDSEGSYNVYAYNIISKKKQAIQPMSVDQVQPTIYEDKIIWVQASSPDNYELYLYNLNTKQKTVLKKPSVTSFGPVFPDIYGNIVVWEEQGVETGTIDTASQIYALNLDTQELKKLSSPSATGYERTAMPKIYDNIVVWADRSIDPTNSHINIYDLDRNQGTSITASRDLGQRVLHQYPNIYQNKIVWSQALRDLFIYDILNETVLPLNHLELQWEAFMNIYQDTVIFKGCKQTFNKCDIYLLDINSQNITNISQSEKLQLTNVWSPAVYQNKIVWIEEDNPLGETIHNLYMAEIDNR